MSRGKGEPENRGKSESVSRSPAHPTAHSPLSPCCQTSAKRYLKRHRDVATCDTCKMLLLAYGNDRDFDETRNALTEQGVVFATAEQGVLKIIVKPRLSKSKGRS